MEERTLLSEEDLLKALDIRYVDLKFILEFCEDSVLPENKVSAIRGGMGQMLLARNCIRDRDCQNCDFETECMVRRMMYPRYEIQPRFASPQNEGSIGYVLECENKDVFFPKGGTLSFHLLLFGKEIIYFSHFLEAFCMLGQEGLGKEHARYQIRAVENRFGELVVDKYEVHLGRLGIRSLRDYALERAESLKRQGCKNQLIFKSPVSMKYQGEFIRQFSAEPIIRNVFRRIYSMDCFEGKETPLLAWDGPMPAVRFQKTFTVKVSRYSSTHDEKMDLRGIQGRVVFEELPDLLLLVLAAGEKIHIGKNTSFGFGRYVIG